MARPLTIPADAPVRAWHFLRKDRKLSYPPRTPVTPGLVLEVRPPVSLCEHGLHASRRLYNALEYGPGPSLCRVELWGHSEEDSDKLCTTHRKVLWMLDVDAALKAFALDLAEEALAAPTEDETAKLRPRDFETLRGVVRRARDGESYAALSGCLRLLPVGGVYDVVDICRRAVLGGSLPVARATIYAVAGNDLQRTGEWGYGAVLKRLDELNARLEAYVEALPGKEFPA